MANNMTEEKTVQPYEIGELDQYLFGNGTHYELYKKMGAHLVTADGVKGVYFAVWAPHAKSVSVIGEFNEWDLNADMMQRHDPMGIYTKFVPGAKEGQLYKFCIETQNGAKIDKADPFANYAELRPGNASRITDISNLKWSDSLWMKKREKWDEKTNPMSIYEVHMGSWMRHPGREDEGFYTYREFAERVTEYVKNMGYTHVELMGISEYPYDGSWGYQVTGYYAPTSRYGTPEDFQYMIDYFHKHNIGVILDWVPAHFPRDAHGLATFDGTCLYEHQDPRQGSHPHWGTLIYNYGRPQVSNFLISNALYWAKEFHADGIRMDAVASMLYLDYGKNDGEWVANMYGGNENLEAVEFLKHLNSVFKGRKDGAVLIAEESTAWPMITGDPKDGGLGFDYKWNMGWMNDFTNYMRCDPYFRKNNYGGLTFSMLYAYSENFVLVFSHDEVVHGKGSMMGKMPGETLEKKAENLRAAYGFMMSHPGKKLLFMGQDFGQIDEWNENASLEWELLQYPLHKNMQSYVRALNHMVLEHPALYEEDFDPSGFEWINCSYHEESMVLYVRRSKDGKETLLFICNFDNVEHEKFRLGVPFAGKYKEIFNSDAREFGGQGRINARAKNSRKIPWDDRENSIECNIPPMSFLVFSCTPEADKKKAGRAAKSSVKEAAAKKEPETGGRKTAVVKEEVKKTATAKEEPKKLSTAKEEPKKIATAKKAPQKLSTAKEEAKKIATAKEEPKKIATSKEEPKKLSTSKEEAQKITTAKEEPKKLSTAKEEPKKLSTTKEEPKKIAPAKGGE